MDIFSIILIILGLCLFETVSSIDNAIINAEILSGMSKKARQWFLWWGLLVAVFLIRGLLPWVIVWSAMPSLGAMGALTATFSNDPHVHEAIEIAAPILLIGGGVFLIFLFFNWLFLEEKHFGLVGERFFYRQGVWFFAVVSALLAAIVWFALQQNSMMAFGAVLGSTAFFITHGFRMNAEKQEQELLKEKNNLSFFPGTKEKQTSLGQAPKQQSPVSEGYPLWNEERLLLEKIQDLHGSPQHHVNYYHKMKSGISAVRKFLRQERLKRAESTYVSIRPYLAYLDNKQQKELHKELSKLEKELQKNKAKAELTTKAEGDKHQALRELEEQERKLISELDQVLKSL